MKRQFKCFIFDLDGTLVNTVEDLAAAFNHMRKELGFPQVSIAMVQQMIGNGVRDLICQSFANVNIKPTEDELKNAIKLMIDYYKAHLVVKTAAYSGVAETLEFMHKKGIKTAVVTNKRAEAALGLLEQLDLAEYLDCIIGDRPDLKLKPAPDGLLAAAAELGMQLEDCVMVGDNHTDLGAARACNMQSIFCCYGFGAKGNETADYDIEHFAELKEFFQ